MWWALFQVLCASPLVSATSVSYVFYDARYLADIPGVSPECERDLTSVLQGLNRTELWAFQMVDACTKFPSGLLTGNLADYGSYDECVDAASPAGDITGQHCMARLSINSSQLAPQSVAPLWSYCLPSSCPPRALQSLLQRYLQDTLQASVDVSVAESDCHTRNDKEISVLDIASITVCVLFGLVAISSTAYDVRTLHSPRQRPLLVAFSLYTNGKKLFSTATPEGSMAPLHGLRFLSICWVVLGHRYYFAVSSALMNTLDYVESMNSIRYQLISGAVLAVDTFFLLSGLLNAYHLFSLLDKTRGFPAVQYYVHRYLRTTPALAAMVLVYASWYSLLGDGPNWTRVTGIGQQLCLKHWWPTLLYINNYYNPVEQCAGQSWYLAADMQLYWLSPLVLLPIWKWPGIRHLYLALLLAASVAAQFAVAYVARIRMAFTISQDWEEFKKVTELLYLPTHTRATPYIVGLALGLHLYRMKKAGLAPRFSKRVSVALWLVSATLCLTVILGNHPFFVPESQHPYDRLESSFYIALHRVAWSLGISWVILACLSNRGGFVRSLLSWRAFVPLSRLTYCIFLCHMAVQQYQLGTVRTTAYFQDFDQAYRYLGDLAMATACAAVLSLLFESPVMVLEKLTLWKQTQKEKRESVSSKGAVNPGFVSENNGTRN